MTNANHQEKPNRGSWLCGRLGQFTAMCATVLCAFSVSAETYYLAGTDAANASAMIGTGSYGWTDTNGTTTKTHNPSEGNDYVVAGNGQSWGNLILRTPTATDKTFGGDSLTLKGKAEIKVKVPDNGVVTIPNLIIDGEAQLVHGDGKQTKAVDGAITVNEGAYLKIVVNYDTATDARKFDIRSSISGAGEIWSGLEDDKTAKTPFVKFSGSMADFTGKLTFQSGKNVASEVYFYNDLPGDPAELLTDGFTLAGKPVVKFMSSGTLGYTRGIALPDEVCEIYVEDGQTVQINGLVTGTAGFKKTGAGTLALASASPGLSGTITVAAGTLQLCDIKENALPNATVIVSSGATLDENGPVFSAREMLVVTGEPSSLGVVSPAYGQTMGLAVGETLACSAVAVTNAEETVAAECVGYKVYTNGVVYVEGEGNCFTYEHPDCEKGAELVWQWSTRFKVSASADAGGTVGPAEQWVAEGEEATVEAIGDDSHDFRAWEGVTSDHLRQNPLKVTVLGPTDVKATFVSKGGVLRAWNGGDGFWEEPTNWTPAGVPTLNDEVEIASGTVWAKSALEVGKLDIGAGAALFFASTGTVSSALAAWSEEPKSRSFMVAGDLTCAGTLVVGGLWTVAEKDLITELLVSVGGNLTLTGAARTGFYAATTPSEFSWDSLYAARTTVAVGGTLSVDDTAILYPTCDELTGAPLCFTCESFNLAVGAKVNARERGWAWQEYFNNAADIDPRKTGTSTRTSNSIKYYYFTLARHQIADSWGSHACYGAETKSYGYAYAPFMPGSPTCTYYAPKPGGGQFWLVAHGTATVEGQVLADATTSTYGPASGGGIWLCAKKLVAGDSALLSAHGGQNSHGGATGGGTGGRISLGLGLSATDIENLAAGATPAELGLNWQDSISEIPVDCSGNRGGAKDKDGNYYYSQPGTVTAVYGSEADTTVTVYGNHAELGEPVPGYGASSFEKGSTQTFTCPAVGYSSASERYSCVGYVVSNATAEVAHGDTTSFSIEIGAEPLSVTWIWGAREIGCTVNGAEGATVSVNGVSGGAEGATKWLAAGEVPVVSVAPDAGYEFLCWEGPIPYGQATANPLTLPADVIRSVRPVVRPVADPTTRTYNQSNAKTVKAWTDPTAWTPQGVPGADDDIVIAGKGTLLASNYFACASLTLKDSAVFKIAGSASSLLEEAALVVSGDLTMTNTAALTVAPRNQYRRGNLTVGGDLTLFGGTLTVSAGPTNGVDFTYETGAGFVTVGGSLTVLGSSTVVPNSDPWTGGSVVFTVGGDFTLVTNAAFKANNSGFQRIPGKSPITWGPGWGYDYTIGAGYGGYGSGHNATYGNPYGFALAPIYPGSPSGEYGGGHTGGGLIRIHATGNVFLDGLLDASATAKSTDASSASGGGVWVTAGGRMTVSPGARLLARGGYRCTGVGKPGGGGRIALAQMVTQAQIAAMAADGAYHGPGKEKRHVFDDAAYLADHPDVTIDVNGGEAYAGGKGTFRFVNGETIGLILMVQ